MFLDRWASDPPFMEEVNLISGFRTMANRPRVLTVAMVFCVVYLPGCSAAVAPDSTASRSALSISEGCASLESALEGAGLSWPVANQRVSAESSAVLIRGFEEVVVRTEGDFRITLHAWIDGFRFVSPYLLVNDPEGAEKAANDVQKETILLANTNLATFCHW